MLFQGDEMWLGGGVLVDDGFLYLYENHYVGSRVARAPLADALERSAWRFYAGDGHWTTDRESATNLAVVTTGVSSVHWNEYLEKYLAVHGQPGPGGGIAIQTADRPEGPWSSSRVILEGEYTEEGRNLGLLAHPEFAREGGRIQYATYAYPLGLWAREIRLVEITFK